MFCEPLRGRRRGEVTDRRTKVDWARQMQRLVHVAYPEADRITLVMDHLHTHAMALLYEAFTPTEARRLIGRLEPVYTAKHGSRLDIAEIELNVLGRQCPGSQHSGQADVGRRGWCAGERTERRTETGERAIHVRRRPYQIETAVPTIRGVKVH